MKRSVSKEIPSEVEVSVVKMIVITRADCNLNLNIWFRIVLKIPLMNTKQKYEVYKVHNLPVPVHHVSAESNNYLVKYTLVSKVITLPKVSKVFFPFLLSKQLWKLANLIRLVSLAYINKSQYTEKQMLIVKYLYKIDIWINICSSFMHSHLQLFRMIYCFPE